MNIQLIKITKICNINFLDITITSEVEVNDFFVTGRKCLFSLSTSSQHRAIVKIEDYESKESIVQCDKVHKTTVPFCLDQ
jgi:hypothetical protein